VIIVLVLSFIIIRILFLSIVFPSVVLVPSRSQVITLREVIVTVAGDNILDGLYFETWSRLSR
jgi:hypothetical protein